MIIATVAIRILRKKTQNISYYFSAFCFCLNRYLLVTLYKETVGYNVISRQANI